MSLHRIYSFIKVVFLEQHEAPHLKLDEERTFYLPVIYRVGSSGEIFSLVELNELPTQWGYTSLAPAMEKLKEFRLIHAKSFANSVLKDPSSPKPD